MSIEQQAGLLLVYMQAQQIQIAADAARLVLQRGGRKDVECFRSSHGWRQLDVLAWSFSQIDSRAEISSS